MNKTFLILAIVLAPLPSFAQLKVNNYGKMQVGPFGSNNVVDQNNATVIIGDNANYVWSDFGMYNMGLQNCKQPDTSRESIGLYSEVYGSSTSQHSTAILGLASGSSTSNYGVVGAVNGGKGAGIYGTTGPCAEVQLNSSYAGYFDGCTYVNGNLTTTALYNLSDIRLKKNITLFGESAETEGSAVSRLQKLNVIEYNLLDPAQRVKRDSQPGHFRNSEGQSEIEKERRHYGVSAQELQKIYPNLVLEGQDGYLAVNYVELVPILIRSIQELKTELDVVKGISKSMTRSVSDETSDFSTVGKGNVLYQNTPNPFKGQTIIRFSLADDVQNACICIYDMTGKQLRKLPISSGDTQVTVNSYELGEGMFFYSLIVNGQEIDTKKMVVTLVPFK